MAPRIPSRLAGVRFIGLLNAGLFLALVGCGGKQPVADSTPANSSNGAPAGGVPLDGVKQANDTPASSAPGKDGVTAPAATPGSDSQDRHPLDAETAHIVALLTPVGWDGLLASESEQPLQDKALRPRLMAIARDASQPEQIRLNALDALKLDIATLAERAELHRLLDELSHDAQPVVASFALGQFVRDGFRHIRDQSRSPGRALVSEWTAALVPGLHAPQEGVRVEMLSALEMLRAAEAAPALLDLLQRETAGAPYVGLLLERLEAPADQLAPALLVAIRNLVQAKELDFQNLRSLGELTELLARSASRPGVDLSQIAADLAPICQEAQQRDALLPILRGLAEFPADHLAPLTEILVAALDRPKEDERAAAATVLARMGRSASAATPALIQAWERAEKQRPPILLALGRVGDPQLVLPLLRKQLSEAEDFADVAAALCQLGDAAAPVIPEVTSRLDSETPELRRGAALALAGAGPAATDAVPKLRQLFLDDEDDQVGVAAGAALAAIAPDDEAVQQAFVDLVLGESGRRKAVLDQPSDGVIRVLMALLQSSQAGWRQAVLRGVGGRELKDFESVVRAAVKNEDAQTRELALVALATHLDRAEESAACWLELMATGGEMAGEANWRLKELGDRLSPEFWDQALRNTEQPAVRLAACRLIGELNSKPTRLRPALEAMIAEADPTLRSWAAVVLAEIDRGAVADELLRQTASGGNDEGDLRLRALQVLPRDGVLDEASEQLLLKAAADSDLFLAEAAARTLGDASSTPSRHEALAAMLGKAESSHGAALAILMSGDAPESLARHLGRAMATGSEGAREYAAQALSRLGDPATPWLMVLVKGEQFSTEARARALEALGQQRTLDADSLSVLSKLVDGDDPRLRLEAATALANHGQADPRILEALMSGLRDDDAKLRERVAIGLEILGERAAAIEPALLELSQSRDPETCDAALSSLLAVAPDSTQVQDRIIELIQGAQGERYLHFAVAHGPKLEPALIEMLRTGERRAVVHAAQALALLGDQAQAAIEPLRALLGSEDAEVQAAAAISLSAIAPDTPGLIDFASAALDGDNPSNAFEMIAHLGPRASPLVDRLRIALTWEERDEVLTAVPALGEAAAPVTIDLRASLPRDAWAFREVAATFAAIGPGAAAAVPDLTEALSDPQLIDAAAVALARLGPANSVAVERLTAMLDDPNDRLGAIRALAEFQAGAAPAVPRLVALLDSESQSERKEAIAALGAIGPPAQEITPRLIALLSNSKSVEPIAPIAASALAGIGNPEALDALAATLERPEAVDAALVALEPLGDHADRFLPKMFALLDAGPTHRRLTIAEILEAWGPKARAGMPDLIEAYGVARNRWERGRLASAAWAIDPQAAAAARIPRPREH